MKIRTLLSLAALAALSSAQAATSIYFGDALGNPIASLVAPAVGSTFGVSVWYSSDVALLDGEILLGFDRTTGEGPLATPLDGDLGLADAPGAAVSRASDVNLSGVSLAGGGGAGTRAYGLSILSVSSTGGELPATSGKRLFDVTFRNLGLTAGESAALSFHTSSAPLYRTYLLDGQANEIAPTVGSLAVQAVPEPGTVAVLGLGVLGLRRRRKG